MFKRRAQYQGGRKRGLSKPASVMFDGEDAEFGIFSIDRIISKSRSIVLRSRTEAGLEDRRQDLDSLRKLRSLIIGLRRSEEARFSRQVDLWAQIQERIIAEEAQAAQRKGVVLSVFTPGGFLADLFSETVLLIRQPLGIGAFALSACVVFAMTMWGGSAGSSERLQVAMSTAEPEVRASGATVSDATTLVSMNSNPKKPDLVLAQPVGFRGRAPYCDAGSTVSARRLSRDSIGIGEVGWVSETLASRIPIGGQLSDGTYLTNVGGNRGVQIHWLKSKRVANVVSLNGLDGNPVIWVSRK